MADFCNVCSERMFGNEIKPDIDVDEIIESLKPGYMRYVICEGCGMSSIRKQENGTPVIRFDFKEEVEDRDYSVEEWRDGNLYEF